MLSCAVALDAHGRVLWPRDTPMAPMADTLKPDGRAEGMDRKGSVERAPMAPHPGVEGPRDKIVSVGFWYEVPEQRCVSSGTYG